MSTQANGGSRKHTSLFGDIWQDNPIARRDRFISQHLAGLSPDALVINVGCGTVRRFESECARYLATDLRPLPNVDFSADLMALPMPDRSVDAIVALEVLEHVPHPRAALKELRRAVKPGGTVIVSVPSTVPRHDHHDYWRFTAEGLRQLCSEIIGRGDVHVFGGTFETLGTIIQYYMALVLHVLRLPSRRLGRIFPSIGYWLDRRNTWSSSTTDLHTLAFDLLFIATPGDAAG
ncbi:MAG: class I SAM-dependent methyltransferase [Acidimicrobiales bacterium]